MKTDYFQMCCLYHHSNRPFNTGALFVTLGRKNRQFDITGHHNLDIGFKIECLKIRSSTSRKNSLSGPVIPAKSKPILSFRKPTCISQLSDSFQV